MVILTKDQKALADQISDRLRGKYQRDVIARPEVAAELSVTPETVKRMQRAGKLPALVLSPTLVRYRIDDLAAYMAARMVGTPIAAA